MDRETGEPTENAVRVLRRIQRRQGRQDQDSGEVTCQRVVVLRRPPEVHWTQEEYLRHHLNFMDLNPTLSSSKCNHPMFFRRKYTAPSPLISTSLKSPFRIPFKVSTGFKEPIEFKESTKSTPSKALPKAQKERTIYVSIWKEHYIGDKIFEVPVKNWKDGFIYSPCCTRGMISKKLSQYLSLSWIKSLTFVLILLKIILIHMNLIIYIYHKNQKHEKIHQKCEEKGVKPVFTGSVYHGPIIWTVRNVTCKFCRDQRASNVSLKLLKTLNIERRNAQLR